MLTHCLVNLLLHKHTFSIGIPDVRIIAQKKKIFKTKLKSKKFFELCCHANLKWSQSHGTVWNVNYFKSIISRRLLFYKDFCV